MAVAGAVLNERQKRTLEALCETWVPAVEPDGSDPLEASFLARSAADIGVAEQIEGMMADAMTPEEIAATAGLLDALAGEDFADPDVEARADVVSATSATEPRGAARPGLAAGADAAVLLRAARRAGQQPELGGDRVPGAELACAVRGSGAEDDHRRGGVGRVGDADCRRVVVGSGAGGAVIAAGCAQAGRPCSCWRWAGTATSRTSTSSSCPGMLELYYGGGLATSEDGSIAILAGSTLGGGTVVNYMNCIPTPEQIVDEWAAHGLEGLDAPDVQARPHRRGDGAPRHEHRDDQGRTARTSG